LVCGKGGGFVALSGDSLREAMCATCGAKKRSSDLAGVLLATLFGERHASLVEALPALSALSIFEAQAAGAIHNILTGLRGYCCAEYLDGVGAGRTDEFGIRCEDLECLSFADGSFDLVITQDVLEHVARPTRAFREIQRVLKSGGCHIFTVPIHEGHQTRQRITTSGDRASEPCYAVHHGNPLSNAGSLVFTDFGDDLPAYLAALGIPAELVYAERFYGGDEIPWLFTQDARLSYESAVAAQAVPAFLLYNSIVAKSWKPEAMPEPDETSEFTGERYLPTLDWPEVAFEHWHRYLLAAEYLAGKVVLDIACGEGYGSHALAAKAARVVAVDISADTVRLARSRYGSGNLEFICGSCVDIPVPGTAVFDAVVSFETLEHLSTLEQRMFLDEVRRVLKPGGLFIVSTPNKHLYSDEPAYCNPYHVKEYTVEAFRELLAGKFASVKLMGQKVYPVSYIWPTDGSSRDFREFSLAYRDGAFRSAEGEKQMLYAIAMCSDSAATVGDNSILVDLSSTLMAYIKKLEDYGRRLNDELALTNSDRDVWVSKVDAVIAELARTKQAADERVASLERQLAELTEQLRLLQASGSSA
jgi:2-polyprenyl-3-methyl-5-hydroxy-6-metoxy-1,4-benzoquinol methylase